MLLILKIILFLILFLLFILAAILFIPFKTNITGTNRHGNLIIKSKAYWISWLLSVKILYINKKLTLYIQILGLPVKIPLKQKEKKPVKDKIAAEKKDVPIPDKEMREARDDKNIPESGKKVKKKTFRIDDIKASVNKYNPFLKEIVFPQLKCLFHYFHVRVRNLDLTFASEDPSIVGMAQGAVSAIVPFVRTVKFLEPVSLRYDYVRKNAEFYADVYFSMNLYGIVIRLFIIWWHYRKMSRAQIRINHESDS